MERALDLENRILGPDVLYDYVYLPVSGLQIPNLSSESDYRISMESLISDALYIFSLYVTRGLVHQFIHGYGPASPAHPDRGWGCLRGGASGGWEASPTP